MLLFGKNFIVKEKTGNKKLSLIFDNLQILTGWVNFLSGGHSEGAKGFMFFTINFELSLEGLGMQALVHNQPLVENSNFGETDFFFKGSLYMLLFSNKSIQRISMKNLFPRH